MLDLDSRAKRFIGKLPPKHARQIGDKLAALLGNPFPPDSKRLKKSIYWRADSGEYRIAYKVIGRTLYVPIIGKRNDDEVYRRLRRLEG
jgi:mRNA interferase RelE/StbE